MTDLIQKYSEAFTRFSDRHAFSSGEENYTYREFQSLIDGSRQLLRENGFEPQKPIGVLYNSRVETFAAIFAIWFSGGIYVPVNPSSPLSVNEQIIKKYQIDVLFFAGDDPERYPFSQVKILHNRNISAAESTPIYNWDEKEVMYVLNTSGSTGTPKHVAISIKNLTTFIEGYLEKYPELDESDNFLQTYELTADASFTGFVIPFLLGATVYSVPGNAFKPFAVAKILAEKPITWVKSTPSLLACLRPFFSSFHLPGLKHYHFGGEALPADMVDAWRHHIPNAEVSNGYGPTETTVTATIYKCLPGENLRSKNNIVCIGLPFKNVEIWIQKTDPYKETGELFLTGDQVMEKYWFSEKQPFKRLHLENRIVRFYPTGDQVWQDPDGYLHFSGRLDDQVKISGYRIDLVEIENAVRSMVPHIGNVAAVAVESSTGMKQLVVFIENYSDNSHDLIESMALHFPRYQIPEKIISVKQFPLNNSGKIDKKMLMAQFYPPPVS
ncbi:MAG: AMP-binding protein [Mariniphaga sp.]|nr:AMP-binding protein [Mariniphaga sp.]MDD4226113.1 AMP-binding protein [Mariniphaga sp.]MDD4425272.1 AMP-binding protein [Mariniphaga sp.]